MKYWEIIADNLKKRGWTYDYVSIVDSQGRTIWIVDAYRGARRPKCKSGASDAPRLLKFEAKSDLRSVILCPVRSRIIILGALIAAFVNVRGAQAR